MKQLKFFITAMVIMIVNNLLFEHIKETLLYGIQAIVAVVGIFLFSFAMINLMRNPKYKNYFVPLWLAFVITINNTQSLLSKILKQCYPAFYEKYSGIFFGASLLLFFAVIWMYKMRRPTTAA